MCGKNRRHVSDSNGHVYENTTCGIDFDGLQILLNTQFQCFSVLILIDEKTLVTYNIEMGVESICFQKPIFLFMFHLSEFSKTKAFPRPSSKTKGPGPPTRHVTRRRRRPRARRRHHRPGEHTQHSTTRHFTDRSRPCVRAAFYQPNKE